MTCNVSSGTLNSTCHTLILVLKLGRHTSTSCKKVSHHWHCLLHMRSTLRKQHFVTKQEMSHKLALMNYLGFVSTPRPHDADPWVEVAQNPLFQTMHPLFEKKIFLTPATSTPVERIFSHSGLNLVANIIIT